MGGNTPYRLLNPQADNYIRGVDPYGPVYVILVSAPMRVFLDSDFDASPVNRKSVTVQLNPSLSMLKSILRFMIYLLSSKSFQYLDYLVYINYVFLLFQLKFNNDPSYY